jgi:hypothetical protein
MFITLPLVPDRVTLIPLSPIVEPDAVVFPEVLVPTRLNQLFSAAAPGAATLAVMIEPALVPKVTLLALEKPRSPAENEPLDAEAVTAAPPPGAAALNESVSPLEAEAVVPEMFVKFRVGLPCEWLDCAAVVR